MLDDDDHDELKLALADVLVLMEAAAAVADRAEMATLILRLEELGAVANDCTPLEHRRHMMAVMGCERMTEEEFFRKVMCGLR